MNRLVQFVSPLACMDNIERKWYVKHVSVSLCQLNESLNAYDYKHLVWAYLKPTFNRAKVTKLRVRHWILVGSKILMLLLNIMQHRTYFLQNYIKKFKTNFLYDDVIFVPGVSSLNCDTVRAFGYPKGGPPRPGVSPVEAIISPGCAR